MFDDLCSLPARHLTEPSPLIGDFNTDKHFINETGKTFALADQFDCLDSLGWHDMWRERNNDVIEYSWYSNAGNGFRLDHAFGTDSLNAKVKNLWYGTNHGLMAERIIHNWWLT